MIETNLASEIKNPLDKKKVYPQQEEIDRLARELCALKQECSRNPSLHSKFRKFQSYCFEKFGYLVKLRTSRYKQFSNYQDLEQDGFEALMLACKTYDPNKGSFTWWADKYISTRISRAANAHSTIRYPLKKAKETKPHKTSTIPVLVDQAPSPYEVLSQNQTKENIQNAMLLMPTELTKVLSLIYGLEGCKPHTVNEMVSKLGITRSLGLKLLNEAKAELKIKLVSQSK